MLKKMAILVFGLFFISNIYGCFAVVAGTAAGSGTAIWLSGKLTQEFRASYDQTVRAAENALKSLNLEITKESKQAKVTQLRSKYTDGKEIWIDVRKTTDNSTKVEVRVGAISPDKEACSKILSRIQNYL